MIKKILLLCNLISLPVLLSAQQESWRDKVVESAHNLVKTDKTVGGGIKYNRDCSGTVYAAFAEAGYPLRELLSANAKAGLGGTQTLYRVAKNNGKLPKASQLKPGDLIFFDNTFDRNRNNKSDDIQTHVAIVTKVDIKSGNVKFVHYNTFLDKIVEEELNLRRPDNKDENIILRWPKKNDPQQQRYAGELINALGSLFND